MELWAGASFESLLDLHSVGHLQDTSGGVLNDGAEEDEGASMTLCVCLVCQLIAR